MRGRRRGEIAWSVALLALSVGVARAAPQIGDPAPTLALAAADGKAFRLDEVRAPLLVVDFFATWCGPCQLAMRALDQIVGAQGGRAQLVVVDVGEEPALVAQFFAAHPPPAGAVVVCDPTGATARRWGQTRFPTTFLVDERRVIRHINRGFGSGYAERVDKWLRAMAH